MNTHPLSLGSLVFILLMVASTVCPPPCACADVPQVTVTHRGSIEWAGGTLRFNGSGDKLVTTGQNDSRVWNAVTAAPISRVLHDPWPVGRIVSPEAYFASGDRRVVTTGRGRVWDLATSSCIAGPFAEEVPEDLLCVDRDGTRVVVAGPPGNVGVYDVTANKRLVRLSHVECVDYAAYTASGKRLVTSEAEWGVSRKIHIWDASTFKEVCTAIDTTGRMANARYSGLKPIDCSRVDSMMVVAEESSFAIYDTVSGKPSPGSLRELDLSPRLVKGVCFSPDGSMVVVVLDNWVMRWDIKAAGFVGDGVNVKSRTWSVDKDASHILVDPYDGGESALYDLVSGRLLYRFQGSQGPSAMTTDGRTIATHSREKKEVDLWDVRY